MIQSHRYRFSFSAMITPEQLNFFCSTKEIITHLDPLLCLAVGTTIVKADPGYSIRNIVTLATGKRYSHATRINDSPETVLIPTGASVAMDINRDDEDKHIVTLKIDDMRARFDKPAATLLSWVPLSKSPNDVRKPFFTLYGASEETRHPDGLPVVDMERDTTMCTVSREEV